MQIICFLHTHAPSQHPSLFTCFLHNGKEVSGLARPIPSPLWALEMNQEDLRVGGGVLIYKKMVEGQSLAISS